MDTVSHQKSKLDKYSKSGKADLSLPTRYFSQLDNFTQPNRTCSSSSNAMYLNWLQRAAGSVGIASDDEYLEQVLRIGDTTEHWVHTNLIKKYGYSTQWNTDGNLGYVNDLITNGFPVVVNILHRGSLTAPRGGHIILLCSYNEGFYTCQDPYGTLVSDYQDTNGRLSTFGDKSFKKRWQGGYRTLA